MCEVKGEKNTKIYKFQLNNMLDTKKNKERIDLITLINIQTESKDPTI